jgi:hypothetical protein
VGSRFAHGGAERADAAVHVPPSSVRRQSIEVDQVVFQAGLGWERLARDGDQLLHPGVSQRLAHDCLSYEPGCADK